MKRHGENKTKSKMKLIRNLSYLVFSSNYMESRKISDFKINDIKIKYLVLMKAEMMRGHKFYLYFNIQFFYKF